MKGEFSSAQRVQARRLLTFFVMYNNMQGGARRTCASSHRSPVEVVLSIRIVRLHVFWLRLIEMTFL